MSEKPEINFLDENIPIENLFDEVSEEEVKRWANEYHQQCTERVKALAVEIGYGNIIFILKKLVDKECPEMANRF